MRRKGAAPPSPGSRDRRFMKPLTLLSAVVLSLLSCTHFTVERDEVETLFTEEVRIVHVTDLHLKKEKRIYDALCGRINRMAPDLLFLTGDSIDKKENLPLLDRFLQKLDPGIRKYAVLGNWEHWSHLSIPELRKTYERNGVKLLINQGEEILFGDRRMHIYGTDDSTGGTPSLENLSFRDQTVNVILTHSPAYFDTLAKAFGDARLFVFSGHTHGGQVTLFGKPLFLPPGSGDYVKGIYTQAGSRLYLSKGIGTSLYDIRLFAKPDIFAVTFR